MSYTKIDNERLRTVSVVEEIADDKMVAPDRPGYCDHRAAETIGAFLLKEGAIQRDELSRNKSVSYIYTLKVVMPKDGEYVILSGKG